MKTLDLAVIMDSFIMGSTAKLFTCHGEDTIKHKSCGTVFTAHWELSGMLKGKPEIIIDKCPHCFPLIKRITQPRMTISTNNTRPSINFYLQLYELANGLPTHEHVFIKVGSNEICKGCGLWK